MKTLLKAATVATAAAGLLIVMTPANAFTFASGVSGGIGGTLLAYGATDLQWTVSDSNGTYNAVVLSPQNQGLGSWVPDSSAGQWLAPVDSSSPDPSGQNDQLTYTYNFNLTSAQAATASVAGQWTADDVGIDVYLNGNALGAGGFAGGWGNLYNYASNSNFVAGNNQLSFVMIGTDNYLDGILMNGTVSVSPVPEASTTSLFALISVLGLGALVLRRKQISAKN